MSYKIVEFYVPSTKSGDQQIPAAALAERIKETAEKLAALFGGSFAYNGIGSYLAESGEMITEQITICRSYVIGSSPPELAEHYAALVTYAKEKIMSWQQESILLVKNGIDPDLIFAETAAEAAAEAAENDPALADLYTAVSMAKRNGSSGSSIPAA